MPRLFLLKPEFTGTIQSILGPVGKILSGSTLSQILSFLALPIISRLYTPAEFGSYGFVLAIVGLVAIVSSLQLHQAIVIPTLESRGREIFMAACASGLVGGVLGAFVTLLYELNVGSGIYMLPLLIGLAISSTAMGQAFQALAVRNALFARIGLSSVLRVMAVTGIHVGVGYVSAKTSTLLIGYVVGEIAAIAALSFGTRLINLEGKKKISLVKIHVLVRKYKDFTCYGTAQEMLNSASQGLPVILLNTYFGSAVAGAYAFSIRILQAPAQLIGNAFRHVLAQKFARQVNKPTELCRDFRAVTVLIGIPALLAALLLSQMLPDLFSMIFGVTWRPAGEYGSWLIFWCVFLVANIPSSVVLRVLRKQRESFVMNTAIITVRIITLVIGGNFLLPLETVTAFALISVTLNLAYIYMASRYLSFNRKEKS